MSELFLSSVLFKDFRTFGSFEAEIVPAPGLTLLVGTNGLGKSSFFDALEWGLTGEVRRFKSYMGPTDQGKYLTRREAPVGSHSVVLEFSDGSTIRRGLKTKPAASEVVSLLKKPAWTAQIEDIGTYLAFTHFLGQAAQQRFTSRDRNEQWASLKGPSGIDRLDEVRNGLRGRATEMAFNRRIQSEKDVVAAIERQLAEWQAWCTRLARLREATEMAGAIPADTFARRLDALIAEVAGRAPDYRDDSSASPAERLIAVGATLRLLRRAAASRRSLLQSLADVPQRYAIHAITAGPDNPAVAEAIEAATAAVTELSTTKATTSEAREALVEIRGRVAAIEAEVAGLDLARSDLELEARAAASAASTDGELKARRAALARARAELEEIQSELAVIEDRASTIAGLKAALAQARSMATRAEGLVPLRSKLRLSMAAQLRAEQDAVGTRDQLAKLVSERAEILADLHSARTERESARSRASALAAAVAAIASHLHDDDTDCPICRNHLQPGQLRLLAEEAANAQNPTLATAEVRVTDLGRKLQDQLRRIAESEAVLRSVEDATRTVDADRRALDELERQLARAMPKVAGDLAAAATQIREQAFEALSTAQAAAAGDEDRRAEAMARTDVLRAEIARLAEEQSALQVRIVAHTAARRSASERLAAAGFLEAEPGRLDSLLADARARLNQTVTEQTGVEQTLRRALEAESAARSRQEGTTESAQRLAAARETALASASALELRWQEAGLVGAPNVAALEAALSRLGEAGQELARLEDERSALAIAYEAAGRGRDLQDLLAEMERAGGKGSAQNPASFEAELRVRLDAATEALETTQMAHAAVTAFADKLRDEARKFSNQFLTPLNGLIDEFNEALLSTPGETVRLNATYHRDRTQFGMGLHYRDPLDDSLYDTGLPPQVVLSEGQLAANGFSILCAASTAYPWSHWRALLMDDPLQHNDIIHAAAFVDLMRNLVELRAYQLIMSSHDRGEAEFIRRKFDAAGLPCSVINLTAPSRSGVRYLSPDHNGPARNAIAARLARSA